MNTYRDNLRETIKDTLADIRTEKERQGTLVNIAEDDLFFAEGTQSIASNRWEDIKSQYKKIHAISVQGVACGDQSGNLTNTAGSAAENVAKLVSNTATAANNVQVAANAIAKLAASMGSAKNISFATMQGSSVDDQVKKAEQHIKISAYLAEKMTIDAMQSTSNAAQIMTPKVFEDVKVVNEKFAEVELSSQTRLETVTDAMKTTQQTLSKSNTELIVAKGKLKAADKIYDGTVTSLTSCNDTLNFNLSISDFNDMSAKVCFDAFLPEKGKEADGNKYFIFVAKADLKETITYEFADNNFHQYSKERFFAVENVPRGKKNGNEAPFSRVINFAEEGCDLDVDGDKIERGTHYVLFIFMQINDKYKRRINNFNDKISTQSDEFVLTTKLAKGHFVSFKKNKLTFELPSNTEKETEASDKAKEDIELRLMFLPVKAENNSGCYKVPNDKPADWFTVEIAEQVSQSNYQLMIKGSDGAAKASDSKSKAKSATNLGAKSAITSVNNYYVSDIGVAQTDVFGSLISQERKYIPVVLTIIDSTSLDVSEYASALSSLDCEPLDLVLETIANT
jgi:hypothetical protein